MTFWISPTNLTFNMVSLLNVYGLITTCPSVSRLIPLYFTQKIKWRWETAMATDGNRILFCSIFFYMVLMFFNVLNLLNYEDECNRKWNYYSELMKWGFSSCQNITAIKDYQCTCVLSYLLCSLVTFNDMPRWIVDLIQNWDYSMENLDIQLKNICSCEY